MMSRTDKGRKRSTTILAGVLLLLGFVLRFWASAHARITGDEGNYWYISRQLATWSEVPIYGPEITGSAAHLPGAMYYYLMAIPQLLGSSPRWGATAVLLGHLVAGWLLFRLLQQVRGERAALFGLALAMFTPWDVLYADRIWGSCVVPIWGSLALYAAFRAKDSPAWQAALIAINLILPQLHLSSPVLWAACFVIVVLRWPRWSKAAIAIGIGVTLLAYAPMLDAEIESGWRNTKLILSNAGGGETFSEILVTPFQIAGYAVFYGSAELSYHFARGYWGGYNDLVRYGSITGWSQWFGREGLLLGLLTLSSIGLSCALWCTTLFDLGKRGFAAIRKKESLAAEHVMLLGLLAGLVTGTALMMWAKKQYFPHYANILMPMLLWPLALGLDRAWDYKPKWRSVILLFAGLSMVTMLINTIRYYRTIDGLNGLSDTIAMVSAVLEENQPVDIRFDHFNNIHAWIWIARGHFERDLPVRRGASVRFRVRNREVHQGPVPENADLFGPILLERSSGGRPKPPHLVHRVSEHWQKIGVKTAKRSCRGGPDGCRYGDQQWQVLRPDAMAMAGRTQPVLFFHPISKRSVVAMIPIPEGVLRGQLLFGLSDGAQKSGNKSPVAVQLRRGDQTLVDTETPSRLGLQRVPFSLTSTGSRTLELEIRTENDGARIFGFDLDLFDHR